MDPYVGIAVFELSKRDSSKFDSSESKRGSFFREDFYIVYADSDTDAYTKVEALAHEQESTPGESAQSGDFVTLRHIVDVAPALYGRVDKDIDLYSRHFASLEDYKRFEMKLGGTDPLAEH